MDIQKISIKNILLCLVRWIVGALFVFAGFVKLVDPVGARIKLTDYLEAFGLHFLLPVAMVLGVLAALLEFVLGWALILKFFKNLTIYAISALTVFFTILTFVLALSNPVSDCGCFGDAIKLTNWETFFKNLVLLALVAVLFFSRKNLYVPKPKFNQLYLAILTVCLGVFIPHYSYYHLPIIDFRPFAVGNHIPTLMKVPEGAPADEYKTIFLYEKNGQTEQFTEDNYPWQDSTWTFVEMKSELINKGAEPVIHDFIIEERENGDITPEVLNNPETNYLFVALDLANMLSKERKEMVNAFSWLVEHGQNPLILTASSKDAMEQLEQAMMTPLRFANVDGTVLKTMARRNPTLMILQDGYVIGKYAAKDFPGKKEILNPLGMTLQKGRTNKTQLNILYLLLVFGVGLGLPHIKFASKD